MKDILVQFSQSFFLFDRASSHCLFSVYIAELIALFLRLHLHSSLNKDTICLLPAQLAKCLTPPLFVKIVLEVTIFSCCVQQHIFITYNHQLKTNRHLGIQTWGS